jgi:hypothetical protein
LIFALAEHPLRSPWRIFRRRQRPFVHTVQPAMPVFFFSIRHGENASVANDGAEFADHNAAWKEMTGVCGAMIEDVSRKLPENAEWQMELLDESRQPVLRIRLVAETLQGTDPKAC